jgi:putative ABC transport system permease protein
MLPGPYEVAVRTTGRAGALAGAIRTRISEIDPSQPVFGVQTLEQALADSIAPRRFDLFLMEIFALAALTLAVIGIYGVVAYSVGARTREIGLRMALGAQRGEVLRMVIGESVITTLAGIAGGLLAAHGLTRLMGSLLYGVEPNDLVVLAAAPCALATVAMLACFIPAFRAAMSDPTKALRYE